MDKTIIKIMEIINQAHHILEMGIQIHNLHLTTKIPIIIPMGIIMVIIMAKILIRVIIIITLTLTTTILLIVIITQINIIFKKVFMNVWVTNSLSMLSQYFTKIRDLMLESISYHSI